MLARQMTPRERAAWEWLQDPDTPLERLSQLLDRWRVDPVCFAVEALRIILLPYQAAILLDLADSPLEAYQFYGVDPTKPKRMVLVPSGHGLGKTRVIAVAIWWMLVTQRYSRTMVTAPTQDQLSGQLWGELRKMFRRLRQSWPVIAEDWEVLGSSVVHKNPDNGDWCAIGRTARADKPESLQGAHALDDDDIEGQLATLFGEQPDLGARGGILVVAEEASGVDDIVRETITGSLSEAGARFLAPGNPTRPDGWFAADINKPDVYAVHCLDCRSSNRRIEYRVPYRDFGGTCHQLRIKGRVEPAYWERILAECEGDEDRDSFRKRVRGIPPRTRYEAVIQRKWVTSAIEREPDPGSSSDVVVIGLDFGLVNDKHAIAVRGGYQVLLIEEWLPPVGPEDITMAATRRAVDAVSTFGVQIIVGDANGVGRGAMEWLHMHYEDDPDVQVIMFNSGELADDSARYYRMRDQMWYREGRKWLSDSRCSLPDHPGLVGQFCAPFFEEDASRRIKVATKKQIKAATGQASGNAADAVLQTLVPFIPAPAAAPAETVSRPLGVFELHFRRLRRNQSRRGRINVV